MTVYTNNTQQTLLLWKSKRKNDHQIILKNTTWVPNIHMVYFPVERYLKQAFQLVVLLG